jgi:hypothetical protein
MIATLKTPVIASAIALLALMPSAIAQESHAKIVCQNIGPASSGPEPVGDRAGHGISVTQQSCRIDSGPWSGTVLTGTATWEWDGPNAVLISGGDVARKAGATAVSVLTEGKLALTMTDGKVTGWMATGKGRWMVGEMAGKSFTFTSKPTSRDEWETDAAVE